MIRRNDVTARREQLCQLFRLVAAIDRVVKLNESVHVVCQMNYWKMNQNNTAKSMN